MSRYTRDGAFAVKKAMEMALRLKQTTLTPAHLLYGILVDYRSPAVVLLDSLQVDINGLRSRAAALITSPTPDKHLAKPTESAQQGQDALSIALKLGGHHVNSVHLLMGLMQLKDSMTAKILADLGVTIENLSERGVRV